MAIEWIALGGITSDTNLTGKRAKIGGLNYDFNTDRFYWVEFNSGAGVCRVVSTPFDLSSKVTEFTSAVIVNNPLQYLAGSTAGGARFFGSGPDEPTRIALTYEQSNDSIPRQTVYRPDLDQTTVYTPTNYSTFQPSLQVQPRGWPGDAAQLMFIWAGPQEKVHGSNYDRLWYGDWSGDTLSSEQLIPNLGQSGAQLGFTLYTDSAATFDVDNLLPAHRNLAFDYKRSDLGAGTTRRFTRVVNTFTDLGQTTSDRDSSTAYMSVIEPESGGTAYHAFINSADTVKIAAGFNDPIPSSESVPGVLHRLATYLIADPVQRTPRRTIYLKFVDGNPATTVQWKVREGDISGAWDAAWSEDTYSIPSAGGLTLSGTGTPAGDAFWLPGFDWYGFNGDPGTPTGWASPANAFDLASGRADFASFAQSTWPSAAALVATGTNAPASGGTIRAVVLRIKTDTGDGEGSTRTKNLAAPSGGWTWAKVQALEVQWNLTIGATRDIETRVRWGAELLALDIWSAAASPTYAEIYGAEIAVIHDGHDGWALATAALNNVGEHLFKVPLSAAGPVQLDGAGANSADGTGTLTTVIQIAGSGASTSEGAGSLGVTRPLAGDGAVAADGTATLTVFKNLDGSGACTADGFGDLMVKKQLASTAANANTGQGAVDRTRGLAGDGPATADGTGTLTALLALAGDGPASSDGVGTVDLTRGLAGAGAAANASTAVLDVTKNLDGAGAVSADGTGQLTVTKQLTSSAPNSAAGSGALSVSRPLASSAANANAATAALDRTRGLASTGANSTDGVGTVSATLALAGDGPATADGSGDLTVTTGGVVSLDGKGDAAADGTGALAVTRPLTGAGAAAAEGQAALDVTRGLAGSGAVSSEGAGTATLTRGLTGAGPATAASQATLTVTKNLDGAGAAAAAGAGTLAATLALAGAGAAASEGQGLLDRTRGLQGAGPATADGSGVLTTGAVVSLDGAGASASEGAGSLTITAALQGAGAVSSDGAGTLTASLALAGDGAASSDGVGTLDVTGQVDLASTAPNSSAGQGALTLQVTLASSAPNSTDGTGSLTVFVPLQGAGAAANTGTGLLTITIGLTGSGAATSDGTGLLDRLRGLQGAGAAAGDGSGLLAATIALDGAGAVAAASTADMRRIAGAGWWVPDPRANTRSPVQASRVKRTDATPW